jgi:hypothetical protein
MDEGLPSGGTLTASNPALQAAQAEYEKVLTDPTHPHYAGYRRGDKAAHDYAESFYRKALPPTPAPGTPSAPSNPAGLAAREEYAKVLSDPKHPHYEGLRRRDPKAEAYVNDLYRKAYPGTTPVESEEGLSFTSGGPIDLQPGETPEEAEIRARNEVILSPLKAEWGPRFEERLSEVRTSMWGLFESYPVILDDLGEKIRLQYGPAGETAALRFCDALADIKRQQGG